ncbi:hypothetical protein CHLRE_12g507400v5 [Chlamydomonas reinhardtii]|uniref:Long-chain-fatty-acid--CoA ligase n=1 Tax=Chlamydomonas reinhardtii TaxID=3055 RepID=A0A2K3D2U0_CHLRE|nr:uncharacterized protein CHLRE_12g507400v5 [Chlamydomonas reinhardtii]PNW74853.1 hypothetical protein CHLRE_12g507400v5 [Chlamydomonas reinhardtii]
MAQAQATAQQRTELLARQLLAAEQANGLVMAPTAGHQHASQVEIPTFSIALPEKLTPDGPWSVYRSATSPFQLVSTYPPPADHVRTLHDNLEYAASKFPHMPYLGWRKRDDKGRLGAYTWMTYAQASDVRTALGSGLMQLGLQPKSAVGIYSVNCKEWLLYDYALHAYGMVSVPLYDTLGPDAVEFIANHAELAAVGVSAAVLPTMLTVLHRCPTVRLLVVWGASGPLPDPPAGASHCRLMTLEAVEGLGRRHPRAHLPPKPSDIATLCYTSGTTGTPKGAVLTHGNLISNAAGTATLLTESSPGDRHLSYLPLAHIYERVNIVLLTYLGAAVGFYSGNVQELLEDVTVLKPQIFASVPRLWNRIYDRVMLAVQTGSPLARGLFERAYAHKRACLAKGDPVGGRWGRLYDRLVFSKIRAKLGGELKYMISGASPISEEVMSFLRICFGAVVLEGYGMTEAACTISTTRAEDLTTGHVGAPNPAVEIKLVDIPEMGYTARDSPYPRGEICVRGPSVFAGYYKDEAQTRDVLDGDGWLHTGDVGAWLEGGRLKIIDRKKNIFKLAQGEYIAPEKIENTYTRSPMVLQVFVYGDSLRSQLVAVVVPDPEVLVPWAKERGIAGSLPELCANPHVRDAVLKSMQEQAREAQLRGFEQVHTIHLFPEPFSVENDMLTPTFKLKRPQAKARFQEELDAMYAAMPATH